MPSTEKLKKSLLVKRERLSLSADNSISTGSTMLNLACTDQPDIGFSKGGYYYLVGDSTSGKTWLSLSCFAECCMSKAWKDYRLIFDDVEGGALMDIEHYFGAAVAKRMESPSSKDGQPVNSSTVQSFYFHITDLIDQGKPFIYVLDSQDGLTSQAAEKKFAEHKKAAKAGTVEPGSYGDGKAKYHSENIRGVLAGLRRTKSILIIIGQTRDNIGMGFDPKTRAGGKALRFYANLEIWTSLGLKIKKTVRDKPRTIGGNCIAEVKKNRITGKVGKDRSVTIPIYYDLGIDDVGSMVDYLIAEKHWLPVKGKKQVLDATGLELEGTRKSLITAIEEDNLEPDLKVIVKQVWDEVEAACKPVGRKRRYE